MPRKLRQEIGLQDSVMDIVLKLSENNPGAISVLTRIIKEMGDLGVLTILNLDDMNIRGTQIWYGYKDVCGEDLKKFIDCIRNRDREMVDKINEIVDREEPGGYRAVTGGASSKRGE